MAVVDLAHSETSSNYLFEKFVASVHRAVEAKGLVWDILLDDRGQPLQGHDWDLRVLNGSHNRHAYGTGGFKVDNEIRQLALAAGWPAVRLPTGQVLPAIAQDFIKALIGSLCLSGRSGDCAQVVAKAARRIFSSTVVSPYEISREHFEALLSLKPWSEKAERDIAAVAKIIDENMISKHCPVRPALKRERRSELLADYRARKDESKLPEKDSLFELTRIVFREEAETFNDLIFFLMLRIVILTGLRINEVLTLPEDCLVWDEHVDIVTKKCASDIGGIGRSLRLRYYAEKQRSGAPDTLIERYYFVPSRFESLVESTILEAKRITELFRDVLQAQYLNQHQDVKSDLRVFKTESGDIIGTWQRLFLTTGNIQRLPLMTTTIPADAVISTPHSPRIYTALGRACGSGNGAISIFKKYGATPRMKNFSIKPHSLRHLMNTELFRQNVSDTVITHQFGRVSVAQTYEYDHRSLAEKLKFVELPTVAQKFIPPGSTHELVAKMVVSGIASSSHIGKSFKRIQLEHGDEAAFAYLAANSDGFHVTPYGFCTNSFSLNPCSRHLKCFDGCIHFAASGLPHHRKTLLDLKENLLIMRCSAEGKPVKTIGRANQIAHATKLIGGVQAALEAQPNENVFPNGADYSQLEKKDLFS
jgi:integrase